MKISRLITSNFRNIQDDSLLFSDGINILFGNNAQGKTNIIEAIYIIGTTKSFRRVDDDQYICFSKEFSRLEAKITKHDLEKDVKYLFENKRNKKIYVNGKQIHKHADYLGSLNVTLFCPEDLMLLKGDASFRRRFMDILFCQTDKNYLSNLMNYQRVLKQRNNALKEIRDNDADESIKEPWDAQMANFGSKIAVKRLENIQKINKIAQKHHYSLNNSEKLVIKYTESICGGEVLDQADYEKAFINKQKRVRDDELRKGCTVIGPHRDDLEMTINDLNTRVFGSQGQKRSVAISLRMAEVDYIYDIIEEYPVLLLDDIFSELDDYRKDKLMKMLNKKMQIFITGTERAQFSPLENNAKLFSINDGKVREKNGSQ